MSEFVKLTLAEKDWTFRALDLDQIEELEPEFIAVASMDRSSVTVPKEGFAAVAKIACESLRFKHPEVTVADCRKLITIGTVGSVIEAVRGVSQLVPHSGGGQAGT